jgi:uncharacterized protein YcbX
LINKYDQQQHQQQEEDLQPSSGLLEQRIKKSHKEGRDRQIKIENFRPNIVIGGIQSTLSPPLPAHFEDHWKELYLSTLNNEPIVKMIVTGPCARCTMVDVNSTNGKSECQVFEALSSYRKVQGHGICFGQFLETQQLSSSSSSTIILSTHLSLTYQ